MDTSGQVTNRLLMPIRPHRQPTGGTILIWPYRLIFLSLLALVIISCTPSIQFGKPPLTDRLDMLTIDVSTKQDIKSILGEPQGYGAVQSTSFGIKEAWLYESTDVEGQKSRLRMLMVFVDKDRGVYHGHLWFASGMLISQTK